MRANDTHAPAPGAASIAPVKASHSSVSGPAKKREHIPTASGTVGPYFPPHFFRAGDNDLTLIEPDAPRAQGQRIHISGHVYEANRVPRFNTIIELWQADAGGRFAHPNDPRHADADPHFIGWGRTWTDKDGYFEFFTVKPGAYLDPVSKQPRAPHINVSFTGSGLMRRLVTTMFFAGEAGNESDPALSAIPETILRTHLMLQLATNTRAPAGVPGYVIDFSLQGDSETPFFAD